MIIESFLNEEQIQNIEELWEHMELKDGSISARGLAAKVKNSNRMEHPQLNEIVFGSMNDFKSQQLYHLLGPHRVMEIHIGIYDVGSYYGWHNDSAITPAGNRTINSAFTIFLNDPNEYDGGELQIKTEWGLKTFKEKKCSIVIYPSSYIHQVTEVTRGTRKVIIGWADCSITSQRNRFVVSQAQDAQKVLQDIALSVHDENKELEEKLDSVNITFNNLIEAFIKNSLDN